MLKPGQVEDLDKADRRHRRIYGPAPTTSQLVASLSLGFWVSLLRRHYNPSLWAAQTHAAFPNLVAPESMADVSDAGTAIQDLRNRIFHQEPLIGHNLSQDYAAILRMLRWICTDTRDWMRRYSSVPKVLRARPR